MRKLAIALAVGCLAALAGCGGGGDSLTIRQISVVPATPYGGMTQVTAEVTGEDPLTRVWAEILRTGVRQSQPIEVEMEQESGTDTWEGSTTLPTNQRSDGKAEVYYVTVYAADDQGRQKGNSTEIDIAAPPAPPADPDF